MSEVGVAILIFCLIAGGVLAAIISMYRTHLVETGRAEYLVKIAASGHGKTYHSPSCNRCKSGHLLTVTQAQSQFYSPCASCGGRPGFVRKKK